MKKLVVLLAAGVLMAGTATLVIWLQLRTERERGAELALRAGAPEMMAMTEVAAPPPGSQAAAVAADVPAPAPAKAAAAAPAGAAPVASAPVAAARPADPISDMMKEMILEAYPDLAAELDLTPAQARQFLDLFATQQSETGTQFMGLMTGGGVDAGQRQQLQRQMIDKERADEAELKKMLGSKYPRWEEYRSTAEARQQVNELRTALAGIGKPLTEPQSKVLVTAFATDASRAREEERAWMASDAARNSPNLMRESLQREIDRQRRLADLAAPHLDAAQSEHFRRKNEEDLAMMTSMLGMMGAGE